MSAPAETPLMAKLRLLSDPEACRENEYGVAATCAQARDEIALLRELALNLGEQLAAVLTAPEAPAAEGRQG